MSVIEKLRKLEAEASELRSQAKKEAMAAVKTALASLNSLGFKYQLVEAGTAPKDGPFPMKGGKRKTGITRHRDPNKPCPVCGEKGHDGRFHRKDNLAKKAKSKSK